MGVVTVLLSTVAAAAQQPHTATEAPVNSKAISVNWLYGAYVPRDVPLKPLTHRQRRTLYLRQTYLTRGIYFKAALFSLGDQISDSPPQWHRGIGGFAQRVGSRYGQFAIQNTLSSVGDLLMAYEPRYDRCRCTGVWHRTRHALMRNFVTYDRADRNLRPQIALYAGALGAGMISSTWKPGPDVWTQGYQSVLTQAAFGSFANVIAEFAPEISRLVKKK